MIAFEIGAFNLKVDKLFTNLQKRAVTQTFQTRVQLLFRCHLPRGIKDNATRKVGDLSNLTFQKHASTK